MAAVSDEETGTLWAAVYPGLFISTKEGSQDYSRLKDNGITAICAVARGLELYFPGSFRYHAVDLLDDGTDDLLQHLPGILRFIKSALSDGGKAGFP